MSRRGNVSLGTKLAFSSGSLEEAMISAAGVATMVFYNQILGVDPWLCGMVFFVASVVDAVSDPLVGSLTDNFRSRWGRRHPFMLLATLPLVAAFYLMYAPPDGLSELQYFWWFLGTMVLLRLGKTFFTIPHDALGAELTDDYHERTSVFGYNTVVAMVGGVVMGVSVLLLVFPSTTEYENGLLDPDRYIVLATLGASWIAVMLLICVVGTRNQIPNLHRIERTRIGVGAYFRDLLELFKSRSYISVCAAWLVMASSGGVLVVVSTYTYIYCYELATETLTLQRFVAIPGILVALPAATYLTRLLDKKMTVVYTCIVCATFVGLPHFLRMIGWFPVNESAWLVPMLFGSLLIGLLVLPIVPIVIDSQLVDVADEFEYNTGRRAEGVVFSIRSFAIKATSGIGGLIGGFGLELIGFPEDASAATLTPEVQNGLLFMSGPLYWIIVFSGMLFMALYNLNRARHDEIMAVLDTRRARTTAGMGEG